MKPRVYADFHNADEQGWVRLNCIGTIQDLARQNIQLQDGLALTLYTDDADKQGRSDELCAEGIVHYSGEEKCWVAEIDWNALWRAPESQAKEKLTGKEE